MEVDGKMIQDALLRLLKDHNIEPPRYGATVRVFPKAIGRSTRYAVVIAYPPAKTALCETLNFLSGGWEGEADSKAGVWVLTGAQAQSLCALKASSLEDRREASIRTLGDLLYADKTKSLVLEKDWTGFIHSIAAGDQRALHALYERTHRIVFTLVLRITQNQETVEEVTLDVFHGVWQRASTYDPDTGSVLGWMMNQARSAAIDQSRLEERKTRYPVIDSFVSWPLDAQGRSGSLGERLALRIAAGTDSEPVMPTTQRWEEPPWQEAAPGISCKLLATDTERDRVSMLVRLAPGVDYPPHSHAGVEELHLLNGELWINDHKLYPGDYNRAEPGTADKRVWSETGCTCVLITSPRDLIN